MHSADASTAWLTGCAPGLACWFGLLLLPPLPPQGLALFLLERFHDARASYLEGLSLEPTNKALQVEVRPLRPGG